MWIFTSSMGLVIIFFMPTLLSTFKKIQRDILLADNNLYDNSPCDIPIRVILFFVMGEVIRKENYTW